ncbi:MAG: S9 family peptidase [Arenimonas sp.]
MNLRQVLAIFLAAFLSNASIAQTAPQIPVADFFALNQFVDIKISPTGEYLAATIPTEDRTALIILRRSDMKVTGKVVLEKKAHVTWFQWVNPERIIFTAEKKLGRLSDPVGVDGVFGTNFDGSKQGRIDLFLMDRSDHFTKFYVSRILDTLLDDDDRVLVEIYNISKQEYQVNKMNVYNGTLTAVATRAPGKYASFYSDNKGAVRFVSSSRDDLDTKMYYRDADRDDWTVFNDQKETALNVMPLGYSSDGTIAYVQIEEESGPDAIYQFDSKTKQRKLLFKDDNVDPERALLSPVDGSVYAFRYLDGKPKIRFLNTESPFAIALRGLQSSFSDATVMPTSFTKDGTLGLYFVYSDKNLGDYYLYDFKTKQAAYVASTSTKLDPELMSTMTPISLKARDNVLLHGFLTIPKGSDGKNLPLVVYPHGGPFAQSDVWGMDPEIQLLANRGYAVLQLNFRGSGNYGRNFISSGYGQWGGTMQDDLTDATKWAVANGIASPKRICIYGASYGAYAALMGAVKEPDLYACAIGNVGVYDLAQLYTDGASDSKLGKNLMDRHFGNSANASKSPNKLADKIKVPILLAAGDEDDVAPIVHSRKMNDALKALGKPVELVVYEKEGHGNYLIKNRIDFANRVLVFLDANIGSDGKKAKTN